MMMMMMSVLMQIVSGASPDASAFLALSQ